MRKLGIIGGVSWSSTALYYDAINRAVAARLGGLHSAPLVLDSLDFAPVAAAQQRGDWGALAGIAADAARRLEAAGAEAILIASNTMHRIYDETAAAVEIPLLHIADATADRLASDKIRRTALLGTRLTMTEPFVRERIERRGIALEPIQPGWMSEVDRIIYEELAAGRVIRDSQRKLKTLMTELAKQKVEAVILGCTELVLAIDPRANVLPVYDTTAIHAAVALEWILGEEQQARAAA